MRATSHSGRFHKKNGQLYSAGHNDRTITDDMPNVSNELSKYNMYYTWDKSKTFAEAEKNYYEKAFSAELELQNERHKNARQYNRVKTIDDLLKSKKTCPDERIISVGNAENHVDYNKLKNIFNYHLEWHKKRFPQIKILDAALHVDEKDPASGVVTAPHIHVRTIAYALDENGNQFPKQDKAFEQMGVVLPKPDEPKSRYNNRKMMYSAECRQNIIALCQKMGLEIEIEPKEKSKSGLELMAYKRQQEEEKLESIKKEVKRQQMELVVQKEKTKALHDLTEDDIDRILHPIDIVSNTIRPGY